MSIRTGNNERAVQRVLQMLRHFPYEFFTVNYKKNWFDLVKCELQKCGKSATWVLISHPWPSALRYLKFSFFVLYLVDSDVFSLLLLPFLTACNSIECANISLISLQRSTSRFKLWTHTFLKVKFHEEIKSMPMDLGF